MIWRPHVTVAAVVERDGRFLFVEEDTDEGVRLNQPAGHLESGESLTDAAIRETREETAWDFAPDALVGIYLWPYPRRDRTYLRFAFSGHLLTHHPEQSLDKGIRRTVWLSLDELAAARAIHRSPQVEQGVRDYLAGQRVSLEILRHMDPGA
ncbi:MAG: NUDIX hydrolase [Acidiferrobacteraceae bacterium]|jgi:8-oxo-dGTP pyrophosphatase MutT (NUDIX family)